MKLAPYLEADTLASVIMASPDLDELVEEFQPKEKKKYPDDPVEFMTGVLGYQMWGKLREICKSVENNKYTVVSSGFGVGKSITAASMACWYMTTKVPSKIIVLAPSFNQVQNVIFRSIRNVGRAANLPGIIFDSPRWEGPDSAEHYAIGISPRRSSAEEISSMHGFHSPHTLVVMDEAAGLPRIVWETVNGLVVGENCRLLTISNPIQQAGPFWEACNSTDWNFIHISCLEHPNVVQGEEVIPGAVSRSWVEERCREWATEVEPNTEGAIRIPWTGQWFLPMPIFQAKVLGIAPEQADDQLIRLQWVIDAQNQTIKPGTREIVIGFDPAPRGGDDNAMCIRMGNKVLKLMRRKGQDVMELAQWVALEAREWDVTRVFIDDIGVGAGVTDRCRQLGLAVVPVNFSRSAGQKLRFANLRSECWWRLRELLREGKIEIPQDNLLSGDLTAPRYKADAYGRILLESKDEIRERIKRSPDSGDSLALTFAHPITEVDDIMADGMRETKIDSRWGLGEQAGTRWGIASVLKDGGRWRVH